ncbi:MAG: DUF2304 domain-containing protein [Proteobacteria bacterium]|uniref:DUF2304 domain-containing protein n=1 Tax=Rudaea sp. TaxID=2136325 RepID=UPI001E0CFDFD|nr:DUF2304 domain-containing protein [Pseudomonadota bacterium]MBS0567856.1 DUF2304 domain-containing protein [Pseudomonadota bacterium]
MTVVLVSALLGIALAGAILYLVRRDHLHGSYALWWLVVAAATLGIGMFPHVVDWLGEIVGIAYPPILAIILGMGLILIRMLLMDVDRSRQERTLRRLTQRLAILDQELSDTRAKLAVQDSASAAEAPSTRKSAQVIALPKSGGEN